MGEFDLSLISEFRSRPSFYDRNSSRFRDKLYNARQWQEISNKLGFDVSILKDRILQLRNRYNLEKRRIEQLREEDPTKYYDSPWPLYEHLHFLANHIRARRSYRKMLPLNGGGGGMGVDAGVGPYATGPELSNSCSNNSNLTLRHVTGPGLGRENNLTAFPNGLLAVKMEDDSDGTEAETESQNNDSEINAFETSGLILEPHSSLPAHHFQQQQQQQQEQNHRQQQQQQQYPSISIRRLDTLRQNFADSPASTTYNKKRKLYQKQQQPQRIHHTSSINQPLLQNNHGSAVLTAPLMQAQLNGRESKYTAFGNFVTSSLLDLPPSIALELVEKFTSDIVKVLMEKAQQEQELQLQQQEQDQEQHCNDSEN